MSSTTASTASVGRGPGAPVALVLPGAGYTAQAPLLAWSVQLLAERGWHVQVVSWSVDDHALAHAEGFVADAARSALDAARASGADGPAHVVAKSLGTSCLPWALDVGLPGAWLTPLSTEPAVRRALDLAGPEHLAVGGDADPWWAPADLGGSGAEIVTVPGADHGLRRAGDWRGSLDDQRGVLERVDAWAARAERQGSRAAG